MTAWWLLAAWPAVSPLLGVLLGRAMVLADLMEQQ